MTNSAKTRPTPVFDKKIEYSARRPPITASPTRIRDRRAPKAKRPKFEFPDERSINPVGGVQSGAKPGGGERNRTDDLLLAKQALSQLSYTPVRSQKSDAKTQVIANDRY